MASWHLRPRARAMCWAAPSAARSSSRPPPRSSFPNADANAEDYREGFGLTEREFKLIKEELEPGSRRFLVKQGHQSVVCELDLKGFEAELAVISGRRSALDVVHQLIARHGADPEPGCRSSTSRCCLQCARYEQSPEVSHVA